MDPATTYALASLGGAAVGNLLGGGDDKRRRRVIQGLNAEAGPSSYEGMEADPYSKEMQLRALSQMANVARTGGMDTQSRARQEQAMAAADAQNRGMQGAIAQNFQMRGAGGSGAELVSRLSAGQGNANQARMAGTQAAADANTRALEAMRTSGLMASNARGQDWGERSDVAGARDAMSRFNAGQRTTKAAMEAGLYGEDAQRKRDLGYGLGQGAGALFGGK